jgi:hypothetical protein
VTRAPTAAARRARRRSSLAIAAVATLIAAGCGSSPPPSLIQLRAQATRICSTASRQLGTIAMPPSEAEGAAFLKHGIAVLGPELGQLRTLEAPTEATDVYRAALSALAGELGGLKDAAQALARQEDPVIAFRALQQRLGALERQADDAWQALQVPTCMSR